jgi:hypothetical protein
MEEFLGFGGENSQTSKLAATSSKVFAKTDPQIPYVRGRVVPKRDSHSMKLGGNLHPNCGRTLAAPEQWLDAKKDLKPLRVQLQ